MKLRTEMRGFADGTYYAAVKAGDTADAINHDAAAAHALMMAIERWAARRVDHALYADHLLGHADELMAQWGFDSGEAQ